MVHQRTVEAMAVLTDDQVDAAAKDLDGWERRDGALRRSVTFPAFLDGIVRRAPCRRTRGSKGSPS